ncbi:MAG: hypothetical protein F6K00_31470 [Leptolyngbya sp. SIOISBB]|nr:hypothetical protein [Leptolyngbya sp. SIOISBB]
MKSEGYKRVLFAVLFTFLWLFMVALARQQSKDGSINILTFVSEYEVGEINPPQASLYLKESSINAFEGDDTKNVTFLINSRATLYEVAKAKGRTHVDIYGWVWSESLVSQDNKVQLIDSLEEENFRSSPSGYKIAKVMPNLTMQGFSESHNGDWTFVKASVWVDSTFLTGNEPNYAWPMSSPVVTSAPDDGAIPSKMKRVTYVNESAGMFSVLLLVIIFHSLIGIKLWGDVIYYQMHSGSGDNVAGNKDLVQEEENDERH